MGSVSSSRSVRASPRRTDRRPLGGDTPYKLADLLAPRLDEGQSDETRSSSPVVNDDEYVHLA
jgi:cytokinesis protein